jgi:hypothetical protein
MVKAKTPKRATVVLGAGASRNVSYADASDVYTPSPLDTDYFDILQRLKPSEKDADAVAEVLIRVRSLSYECWRSLEMAFYTLHLKALMESKLHDKDDDGNIVNIFTRSLQSVLRSAHGTRVCSNHQNLLTKLGRGDTLLSFNYDLVAERAFWEWAKKTKHAEFWRWVYRFDTPPKDLSIPSFLKLHGSSNWKIDPSGEVKVMKALGRTPGYVASSAYTTPSACPILLPFWEKPVEQEPWIGIWKSALRRLEKTDHLLIWGYSLPITDVKTRHLFSLAFENRSNPLRLCVIDPSSDTQKRWRELLPDAEYWKYSSFFEFENHPPQWWKTRPDNPDPWI